MSDLTRYRRKLGAVEAMQWTGDNTQDLYHFLAPLGPKDLEMPGLYADRLVLQLANAQVTIERGDYLVMSRHEKVLEIMPCEDFERIFEPWPEDDA